MQATVVQPDTGVDPAFLEDWNARMLAAWNGHDVDTIVAMLSEDIAWDDPSEPETLQGREAVRRFITETFRAFPDLVTEETEPIYRSETRPKVLVPYRLTGTMLGDWEALGLAATGARVSFEGVDQWEFRDEAHVPLQHELRLDGRGAAAGTAAARGQLRRPGDKAAPARDGQVPTPKSRVSARRVRPSA
jgi:steroid delta-isomerase-like uncharacterized protein